MIRAKQTLSGVLDYCLPGGPYTSSWDLIHCPACGEDTDATRLDPEFDRPGVRIYDCECGAEIEVETRVQRVYISRPRIE